MKSTGLFGKNSGRVGGVVYSNYRGEQVVRAYQPKVKNPNTKKQVAQRAKFKLVSQVGASLGKEIAMSFVPNVAKESPRNAFVRAMLKKTTYGANKASLPIEVIALTNSRVQGFTNFVSTAQGVGGTLSDNFGTGARVRAVYVGYNNNGEIVPIAMKEAIGIQQDGGILVEIQNPQIVGYSNVRALVYVYEPDESAGTSYEDYEVLDENATLEDIAKVYAGAIKFSATENVLIPQNV